MLNIQQGKLAVQLARQVIDTYVTNQEIKTPKMDDVFTKKQGVFVTIHTYPGHDLRGCIGLPLPRLPLKQAIIHAAQSATQDPRFPPLHKNELDTIIIEVTILTQPKRITVDNPKEYLDHIEIGRDGLIVEQGIYAGLLLPQVPIEQQWDKEEFLTHTCMKAGLLPDAWFDKTTKISKFSGQIFTEITPRGDIKENRLNGLHN